MDKMTRIITFSSCSWWPNVVGGPCSNS